VYAVARGELARLGELSHRAREAPALAGRLERARHDETRREEARTRLVGAGVASEPGGASNALAERLRLLESELSEVDERARAAEAERRRAEEEALGRVQELEETRRAADRWQRCRSIAARLERYQAGAAESADTLQRGKERLAVERETLRARGFALAARRESLLAEALRFEHGAGALPPAVLELCEELGGELLAARFEDIEVERAARVQAGLGPLAAAIVVEDVPAALERLARTSTRFDEVTLVRAGEAVRADDGELVHDGLLSVETGHGVRVSRLPERPSLGKNAREARRTILLAEADHAELELERTASDLRRIEAALAEADELSREAALGFGPDPAVRLPELEQLKHAARARVESEATAGLGFIARAGAVRRELETLRPLVSDAHLFDREEDASVAELERDLAAAREAEAILARNEAARAVLAEWLEALRVPPPAAVELERFERERGTLDAERDRWFRAGEALSAAIATRQARGYTGAEAALDESTRLVPALESELEALALAVARADEALGAADARWEERAGQFRELDARRRAIAAHAERVVAEGANVAPDFSAEALADAEHELAEATARSAGAERAITAVSELLGTLRERARQAEASVAERASALALEEDAIAPLEERRAALLADVRAAGLLAGLDASALGAVRSERELFAEARSRREVLVDRLLRARGGQTLAEELARLFASDTDVLASYVAAWRDVTAWLARRLPSQVAEVADPLRALERLRDHLALLEERLGRQELDLRGASEDVARGIEVKLRRAAGQVRRLNQHLAGISFGSIARIAVEMRRVERMDQILAALREGHAQELLFQTSLPVEEALDEIFRRYGGGKSGGQRLLDYREYLELAVEVERKAKPGFEPVSPTRLSTGEAIGVGAALMMVVLTEWERDANLFRNRRSEGTLRFLFLDEANRLSQDNLGVLFDLCQNLELQLLIAAPEVARAAGNTTYRLVRQVGPDGAEEVIVTGRRATLAPDDAGADVPPPN